MAEISPARADGLPLRGTRVVALEQSVAGPLCSRILADLGADVVKVEAPAGDFARRWDAHVHGFSSYFAWLSRRKRSLRLDLRDAVDRGLLERLLRSADVLVTNMSAAAAERLGLTEPELRRRFPRLIACHITGYGTRGRYRDRKAYDMLLQAETGLLDLTGDEAGPARIGVSICDIGTGLYAVSLVLAALIERARSGRGRFIDLSMFQAMTEFAGPNLTAFANSGVRYERRRLRHHNIVPYGVYACADRHLVIAVEHDQEWERFCREVIARPDLLVPRFATNQLRVAHRDEVDGEVERTLRARDRAHWVQRLERIGLAYACINQIDEVWDHPVAIDLHLHQRVTLPDGEEALVMGSPAETAFPSPDRPRLPALDQHREEVLEELAEGG
ncbi:MAG TPA: CaiB/BaiF CoA-transferase family protein [Candidatus Dormibacteraeota bacterium]|nr:CaiB/BaiF CoA-transferase family protein [Candidatus Dormibacteraeota bacterium]